MKKSLTTLLILTTIFSNAQDWLPLNNGVNGAINDMVIDTVSNKLYAIGNFTDVSGVPAYKIAYWDNQNWDSIPYADTLLEVATNANNGFASIAMYDGNLYVSGWDNFNQTSFLGTNHIAMYNGTNWSSVGTGINGSADAMMVYNGELYVAGSFSIAGGVSVNNIAKWDGVNWSSVGNGISDNYINSVSALGVYNGEMYAGTRNTDFTYYLYKFNANAWNPILGLNSNGGVNALNEYNGELYIAGYMINGSARIAKWDGSTLTNVGSGVGGTNVKSLNVFNDELYIGGNFTTAGGYSANSIAKWNGTSYSALGTGTNGAVNSIVNNNNSLYAGGQFTTAGSNVANNISVWETVTDIKDVLHNENSQILFYPNPASTEITVRGYRPVYLKLCDALGQIVAESQTNKLYFGNLSQGLYVLQVFDEKGQSVKTEKIIVAR